MFIIPSLSLGGAERVAHTLALSFKEYGFEISFITRSKKEDFYILPDSVSRANLADLKSSKTPVGAYLKNEIYIRRLRKEIKSISPDLIISFMNRTNIRTIKAAVTLDIPIIITEHNYPPANPLGKIWEKLRIKYYPQATKLVSISKGTDSYFSWMPENKRAVINNPINHINTPCEVESQNGRKLIVSAGRLQKVKNYELLIDSFAKIYKKIPEWDLIIYGEGSERENLEKMIFELKLDNRVFLPGLVSPVENYIKKASIFCLSSTSEGFGNVIIEAMSLGIPVISTNCPTGPSEIICNEEIGVLVPTKDTAKMSEAILDLANNEKKRKKLSVAGLERSKDYSLPSITEKWIDLINSII